MSSKNLKTNIAISVEDRASSSIKKIFNEHQKGETKMAQSHKRYSDARKLLDVRSEKEIQREIQRTEAAYNRLTRAGFKGASDQQRAYEKMTSRVRELNAEMGKTEKLGRDWKKIAAAGGAIVAGAKTAVNIAREPVQKYLDFDQATAYAANVAFSDRDVAGRKAGAEDIKALVKKAIQEGGSKEMALEGINKMLSFGDYSFEEVDYLTPLIQKTSVATEANAVDVAMIINALIQNFQLGLEEIPKALDMAVAAGASGSFELPDMASWLPKQLAVASSRGMKGIDHFGDLLTMNQQAAVVAGTNDEAGNYVNSFLLAILDSNTANSFANSDYKEGDKKGIDLAKSIMAGVDSGQTPVEAFMNIMDRYLSSDKEYQKLIKDLEGATGDERVAKIKQLETILEASKVSEIIGNKQALMGFLGIRLNAEYGEKVRSELNNSSGAVDISHQVIASTSKFKADRAQNNRELDQMEAYKPIADSYANLMQTLEEYSSKYPDLTQQIILATDALKVFIATAAGMAILSKLLGSKGGFGLPGSGRGIPPISTGGSGVGAGTGAGLGAAATIAIKGSTVAGLTAIQKSSSKEYNEAVKQKDAEAVPLLEQNYLEKGDEYLQAAYDKFGPFSIGTKWDQTEPHLMKKYLDQYDNYMALSDQYGEENMQERWKSWRGIFGDLLNTKWYNQSPDELEQMLNEQNSVRDSVSATSAFNYPQTIAEMAENPEYQPIFIGNEIMRGVEQGMLNFQQQQTQIEPPPTIIQLNVTGEVDGREVMEIVKQITIDEMNRGSNY